MSSHNLIGKIEIKASSLDSGEARALRTSASNSFFGYIKYTDGNSLAFFFIRSTWGSFASGALSTSDWLLRRRQAHFVGCRTTRSKAANSCASPENMSSFVLSRLRSSPPCRLALEDLNHREQRIVQPFLLRIPSLPPLRSRAMSEQITRTVL